MITTGDMANIIAYRCKEFGIPKVMQADNIEDGEVTEERIVVIPKQQNEGTYWNSTPIEVNVLTPNLMTDFLNLPRLNEIEAQARSIFRHRISGNYDGESYRYTYTTIGRIASKTLRCGWINIKINFETLNVKNNGKN